MKIYLASASPRRRELLEQIGLKFEVKISNVAEHVTVSEPERVVEELSAQKARAVLEALEQEESPGAEGEVSEHERSVRAESGTAVREEYLIIGADTVVAVDGSILGKPSGEKHAFEMLGWLAGRTHRVYTGVTLLYRPKEGKTICKTFHEMTEVSFYPMSEEEIRRYLSTGDCMDKAGAYGIQGFCARYIKGIQGDYNNVVGLPVGRLYQEAKEWLGE